MLTAICMLSLLAEPESLSQNENHYYYQIIDVTNMSHLRLCSPTRGGMLERPTCPPPPQKEIDDWERAKKVTKMTKVYDGDFVLKNKNKILMSGSCGSGPPKECCKSEQYLAYYRGAIGTFCDDEIFSARTCPDWYEKNCTIVHDGKMESPTYIVRLINKGEMK